MTATAMKPRVTSFAPQFLVDDLERSIREGFLDVFDAQADYRRVAHIPTVAGARTSLFVPDLDALLLAVRATPGEQAAIWVFRPTP